VNRTSPHALPDNSAMALQAVFDGVRHAIDAARAVALATLADAAGGHIRQYNGIPGAANAVMTSGLGTARIVPESRGDRATLDIHVSPAAYERIREHLQEDCSHDDACACEQDPWPALDALPRDEQMVILSLDGEERGSATRSPFGRGDVALELDDESVFKAAEVLRIAVTLAPHVPADETPETPRS
jgi:hypothetical protein